MPDPIIMIPADLIVAGDNDRKEFDEQKLAEFAAAIEKHGLPQEPLVRPLPDGRYEIVFGERRTRAMRDVLKWTEIPCKVREMDDETASALMLAENTNRTDLNPIEEGEGYRKRMERFGWSIEKIARIAGKSIQHVKDRLAIVALAEDVQHFVKTGAFPIGHALLLNGLDINRQRIALRVYNAAKSMPLTRFREEVIAKLRAEQDAESQQSLFALELMLVEAVEQDAGGPPSGKAARTGAPIDRRMPRVRLSMTDNVGAIMDRYITDLLAQGLETEAAALGNVYNALVAFKWTSVPSGSLLAKTAEQEADALMHVQRIDK